MFSSIAVRIEADLSGIRDIIQQNHSTTMRSFTSEIQRVQESVSTLAHGTKNHNLKLENRLHSVEKTTSQTYNDLSELGTISLQRFKAIEAALSAITRDIRGSNTRQQRNTSESPRGDRCPLPSTIHRQFSASIVYFTIRPRGSLCLSGCPCRCHMIAKPEHSWSLPSPLKTIFGSILIGYTAYPVGISGCDTESCIIDQSTRLEVTYAFPWSFLSYKLQTYFEVSTAGSLTFGLLAKRRLPFEQGNILWLAQFGHVDTLKQALETNRGSIHDVFSAAGQSSLQLAIVSKGNSIDRIKILLRNGANPDQEDDNGNTARMTAAKEIFSRAQPIHILRELEILFPPSQCIDDFDFTLIHKVVLGICHTDLISLLKKQYERLLTQVNARDRFGSTALQLAAHRDDLNTVQALIRAGAVVDDPSPNGKTALEYALRAAEARCVNTLLDYGAVVNREDYIGYSPLHIAVERGHLAATKRLIRAGAKIDHRGATFGVPPLSFATRLDQILTIQCLIEEGAPLETPDINNKTPLGYAVTYNAHKSLEAFLHAGANHLHVTNDGWTLLHLAAAFGDVRTMNILEMASLTGMNIHAKDNKGFTPSCCFKSRGAISNSLREALSRLLRAIEAMTNDEPVLSGSEVFEDALEIIYNDGMAG